MASFEQRFYRHSGGLATRLRRDAQLARDSLAFLWLWATAGARLRRACRDARNEQRVPVIEDQLGEQQ
ncbi:MAG: hypothetical protein HKO62_09305 [Gammaproteobacteria bacterium]|nr:hypothetical protein [Gammaproteobacteria bacterium]NNM00933.1 hypothetical protein [Gammaproteobacteria bacterium]